MGNLKATLTNMAGILWDYVWIHSCTGICHSPLFMVSIEVSHVGRYVCDKGMRSSMRVCVCLLSV